MKLSKKLMHEREKLLKQYNMYKSKNLNLDLSRGKPCTEQLDLSNDMFKIPVEKFTYIYDKNLDCRNYGNLEGLQSMKKIFADILQVPTQNIMIGGNSSLGLILDTISCFFVKGVLGSKPWKNQKIKFLCPVPGYDRHFTILDYFGIEQICIPLLNSGPDMDKVEQLVQNDEQIKGMICVPKYSNPTGITYSPETIKRIANLKPLAHDFRIFFDNAYAVHCFREKDDFLLNIWDECQDKKSKDFAIFFGSTSKITFPGAGVTAMAASHKNLNWIKQYWHARTIGYDKINQLRHALFFKDITGIKNHMKKHRAIVEPKFDLVCKTLHDRLDGLKIASWTVPNGGYFVSVNVLPRCAKKVVKLCADIGVLLTPAGSTYPHGIDPDDSNIRLAPTYVPIDELKVIMEIFCIAVKLSAIEKLQKEG